MNAERRPGEEAASQQAEQPSTIVDPEADTNPTAAPELLRLANGLIARGFPVFVARGDSRFDPTDPRSPEFSLPDRWQVTKPSLDELARWRAGWAVCLVTGHGLDCVDVDPKNGADVDLQRARLTGAGVTILGEVETPSGGVHLYVVSTGAGSTNKKRLGLDFRGGRADGSSRGFVYLPGTSRPRYAGRGYVWRAPIDFDARDRADVEAERDALSRYWGGVGVDLWNRHGVPRPAGADRPVVAVEEVPARVLALLAAVTVPFRLGDGRESHDRSARFHHIVGECRRAGLRQDEAVKLLSPWCAAVGKFEDRVEQEVERSWNKVQEPANGGRGSQPPEHSGESLQMSRALAPDRWFDRKDFLVADVAADIRSGEHIMRDDGDRLWRYTNGVWRPDTSNEVRSAVTSRLGNRFRPAHEAAVRQYLLGEVDVMHCEPVESLINVSNGLLDWSSGTLIPHSPAVLSTVQLTVPWNPEAECPKITSWLEEVLPPDLLEPTDDGPGFIWEVLGYLCMSGNPLHKAMLLIGRGRNGKGTFLRLITRLLGPENVSSVDLHSLINNRFRKAELFGKVANIAGDIDASWLESTAEFKAITGGDRVQAERKFGQPFEFTPFAVPVYSANKVFGTSDQSSGFLARWVVIPFPNSFLGREDRSLDALLAQPGELQGLLIRAVEGLRAVMARGNFSKPVSIVRAYERFEDEADPVRGFLRATTTVDPAAWTSRRDFQRVYRDYCDDNDNTKPLTPAQLYERLEIAGLVPRQRKGDRGFIGRRIMNDE